MMPISSTRSTGTSTRPSTRGRSKAIARIRPIAFWLTAAAACSALAACAVLLTRVRQDGRRAAVAELRLRRTRIRLRTAEAELMEADEYLAAMGDLLECYQEEFGPLPVNPFAAAGGGGVTREEWPEELEEVGPREG
jgi:hypothetical protein